MKFKMNLLFEVVTGSRLYGTSRPDSDWDFRGVCRIPVKDMLNPFQGFEQFEDPDSEDRVIYGLRKFMKLASDCNPNVIELLFAKGDALFYLSPAGRILLDNANLFVSKKATKKFIGYGLSQLHRMKTHKRWMDKEMKKPRREDFILPVTPVFGYEKIVAMTTAPSETIAPEWRDYAVKEQQYRQAKKEWDDYNRWMNERNPSRHELESKYGYDCYSQETEFLTLDGWKLYDDIEDDDFLGTINPVTQEIEFQEYTNRFSYNFNGFLYNIKNQITNCLVTENHTLYISKMHRSRDNNFKTSYDPKKSSWVLEPVVELKESWHSYYHSLNHGKNSMSDANVSDSYLSLIGLYVSDGSLIKDKYGFKGVSISQLESPNKILQQILNVKEEFKVFEYKHFRKDRNEITYNIYNRDLAERIFKDCGQYSNHKRLPNWIFKLSKRQADLLLSALLSGDGTWTGESWIYYTKSKELADMVNILALLGEHSSKVWDYTHYENGGIYQVYISDVFGMYGNLILNKRSNHIERVKYVGKVVCFSVPNSVLITRLDGELSFHGNSKAAMHLVRLLTEGLELLSTGRIIFPRPNAYHLLDILNGKYSYEYILEMSESFKEELDFQSEKSSLPEKPNYNDLLDLYYEVLYA